MKGFFKTFLASFSAFVVFTFLIFVMGVCSIMSGTVKIPAKSVLTIDLSSYFPEVGLTNPLAFLQSEEQYDIPAIQDILQLIEHAAADERIEGILLKSGENKNGLANSDEIRKALLQFKEKSGKFVYAYATEMHQSSFFVASAADKIFLNPQGGLDWKGMSVLIPFFKGTLEKLEIEAQIIYAGRFKSATEPFRESKMTEPNKLQYKELMEDLFGYVVKEVATARSLDPQVVRELADQRSLLFPEDALRAGMVDSLVYDDQLDELLKNQLGLRATRKVNYISIQKYATDKKAQKTGSTDNIAVIAAEGDIVDGKGTYGQIGGQEYIQLIRKARLNSSIKAIVVRVNSGGGSALASDEIWHEITAAKKVKPVVMSFGDYAASGGYYLATNATAIVADPNTITGSIGVFGMIPNAEKFLKNKLGVTIDGVATSERATDITLVQPMTPFMKAQITRQIDTIYETFKSRVAEGRNLSASFVDSIAQGRVWSGIRALELGLVDTLGALPTAIRMAADLAGVYNYGIVQYPDKKSVLENLGLSYMMKAARSEQAMIIETMGPELYQFYKSLREWQTTYRQPQLRMYEPFILK